MRDDTLLNKIVWFWRKYGYTDYHVEDLKKTIQQHLDYNTCEVIEKNDIIIAMCRYNIDGNNAVVIDCLVHPEYRNKKLIKLMLIKGLRKFPYVTNIKYQRQVFNDDDWRDYGVRNFLGVHNETM